MPPRTTIRRSLLLNLVVVVLLLGATILGMTFLRGQGTMQRVAESLIAQTLGRTRIELRAFFDPVRRHLLVLREMSVSGALDEDRATHPNGALGGFMREHPWVSATLLADEHGTERMLLRTDRGWQRRDLPGGDTASPGRVRVWRDGEAEAIEGPSPEIYDPRERPWFRGAVDALARTSGDVAPIYWTEPYAFFTTGEPGITASLAFRGPGDPDSQVRVIGLDVTLTDISNFVTAIDVLGRGFAFVLSSDGRSVGLPRLGAYADDAALREALLVRPAEMDNEIAQDIAAAFLEDDDVSERAARFVSGDTAWWGDLQRLPLTPGLPEPYLVVGVAVPEADLLEDVVQQRVLIGTLTLVVLGIAVARAVGVARRFSEPLEALAEESERISTGDLEPGPPIDTPLAEIHRLADAHDHMRQGLQTLFRIEHDLKIARTIQESTYPERLPSLAGFDLAAWSEPADQTGGDTYDVIGLHASVGDKVVLTNGDAGRAALLLADATGHGIGPALSVTQVRAMLRIAIRMSTDLSAIATNINTQLCEDLPGGRFVTCWLGQLDAASGTLTAVSGGQAPLLRYHAAEDRFDVLSADTAPFGLFDTGPIEVPPPMVLRPGDLFVVLSDGIFEAAGSDGEEFGVERVQAIIREHRSESAPALLTAIREAEERFTTGTPPADDRTILIIKREGDVSAAGTSAPPATS